jgi:hypothetical protein
MGRDFIEGLFFLRFWLRIWLRTAYAGILAQNLFTCATRAI